MATRISVINNALQQIGVQETTAISATNPFLIVADTQYDFAKETCIAQLDWRFATRIEQLSRLVERPVGNLFQYYFQLPADFLAMNFTEPNVYYQIFSKKRLATNVEAITAYYRYNIAEEFWPNYFADYVSYELALRMAYSPAGPKADLQALTLRRDEKLMQASFIDNQNQPNQTLANVPVITAR